MTYFARYGHPTPEQRPGCYTLFVPSYNRHGPDAKMMEASAVSIPAAGTNRLSAARVLWLGAFLGLLSGYLESLLRLILPWAPPWRIRLGTYLLWMPAAANFILFFALASLVAAGFWAWKTRQPRPVYVITGFASLAALNLLAVYSPPLHMVSALLLAVGLGTLVGRWAADRDRGFFLAARIGTVLMLAAVAGTAVTIEVSRILRERAALAAAAVKPRQPNILLLVLDNVRALSLSAYGYPRNTSPELAGLAQRGVLFTRAFATSSWSLPSHGSLMTGLWAHELAADWQVPLDEDVRTLSEVLGAEGYVRGGFVGNGIYGQREAGLARGFDTYKDYRLSPRQLLMSSEIGAALLNFWHHRIRPFPGPAERIWHRKSEEDLNREVSGWLDRVGQRPFFAFVNYYSAHVPFYAPPGFGLASSDSARSERRYGSDEEGEYERAIAYVDASIGQLLRDVEHRGLLANTVVIVTSDHGEEFRNGRSRGHGNSLDPQLLRVPLLIAHSARVPAALRVQNVVSIRDVPATVLELVDAPAALPGCSLARYWRGRATPLAADTVYAHLRPGIETSRREVISRGAMTAIISLPWHFIRNGDGTAEMYHFESDPEARRNLADHPGLEPVSAGFAEHSRTLPKSTLCWRPEP